jgi:zinc protease
MLFSDFGNSEWMEAMMRHSDGNGRFSRRGLRRVFRWASGCRALCLFLAGALSLTTARAQEIDIPYEKFVLDNGLTLIVHEDRKAPIVAVNVWYHVGSKNEKPGKTGFAHLFEHLMFNGSENYNDDYFKPLEQVGVTDINGTTNPDRTNYFQNVPSTALDLALWMESDRMGHMLGAVDQGKLDEQRGVVQNEKRQGENQPYGVTRQLLTENTYPAGHPYSWSTIGSMEDLNAATMEDVQEWFRTYYGAANAVIAIAGDVDARTAKARVEHFFGDIPSGPPVAKQQVWIAKRSGEHRQRVEDRVPQARVYKVWNTPEWASLEAAHLDLVTDVLAAGKTSRLYRRLVYEEQLATDVQAFVFNREIAGQVYVMATAQPGGDLKKVEAALDEEMARFLKEGPTEEELVRVKTQHRARFLRGIERIGGFGGKSDVLAMNQVYSGNPGFYKETLERVAEAKPENLRDAAAKWLSDGVYVLEVHPFPAYKNKDAGADRSKLPAVSRFPELDLPPLQKTTLRNGLKVILAERRETPVVEFELVLDAGYAADQFASPGVASLALAMLDEGTRTRSSLEISEALDRLGANLGTSSSVDSSMVSLSALKENLDASLEIYADVILNPSFPDADFQRLKRQRLAGIQQEKSSPGATAMRLLPGLIYGKDHAYGNPLTGSGTEESVGAMTRQDLERFHRTWFQPNAATLVVVGDTNLAEITPRLESRFSGWKSGDAPPAKNIAAVGVPEKRVVYLVDKPGAAQSVIIAGLPTAPAGSPDDIAITAMNSILGGTFTSRINMNLREDKHWSYGARSVLPDARGPRLFYGFAPVQTDKTKESIVELEKEFRDILGPRTATPEELQKSKQQRTLSLPGRFETKGSLRSAIRDNVIFGRPDDYFETLADKVNALELTDIQAAAEKVVKPSHMVWIVIGDLAKFEAGIRELGFDEVKRMDADGNLSD